MAIKYVDMSGMRAVPVRKQGVWISVKRLWVAILGLFEPEEVEVDFKVRQGRVRYTYRKVRKLIG